MTIFEIRKPIIWGLVIVTLTIFIGLASFYYQIIREQQTKLLDSKQSANLQISQNLGGEVFGTGIYPSGTHVQIWANPHTGYSFTGWDGDFILNPEDINTSVFLTYDQNITAHFKKESFLLKLEGTDFKDVSIRDIEGFETSEYFEDSGKKMLSIKFVSADVERPRVGFLRLGLAFLMVRELEILLNTNGLSADFIHDKIKELKSHKGVSYAVAEPATIWLQEDNFFTKISSSKGKLTEQGEFRLWDGVEIKTQTNIRKFKKVKIHLEKEKNWLSLTDLESGQAIDYIQLD